MAVLRGGALPWLNELTALFGALAQTPGGWTAVWTRR
jgi:hypothetical protein